MTDYMNEMETVKKPVRVVTDERWSRDTYVMFEGEEVIGTAIREESITEAYNSTEDESVTREDIAEQLVAEFEHDNPVVGADWPEYGICYAGRYYYRYTEDGVASYLPTNRVPMRCRLSLAWDVSLDDVVTILIALNVKGWLGGESIERVTHAGWFNDNLTNDKLCGHTGYWISDGEYIALVSNGDPVWSSLNDEDACTAAGLVWGEPATMLKRYEI